MASWGTETAGRKTEQEENSVSGGKQRISQGEAATMQEFLLRLEKPICGVEGSC